MTKTVQRKRSGRITLREARELFAAMAPDQATVEAHACPSLERSRYWQYFRLGIAMAQTGRVPRRAVSRLHESPHIKPETRKWIAEQLGGKGTKV